MRAKSTFVAGIAASLACLGTTTAAQTPTFDCSKAAGVVEKLVCSDASLIALDRRLDAVYRAAAAQATRPLAVKLREEQRGWAKGRNDCWKATQKTWITASWTVDTVKDCVDAHYRLRTSELQSVWRLVPPAQVAYVCGEHPANALLANFFDTDPPTARIERGDRVATLWRVGTAAAGLYEGQNVSLVRDGSAVTVRWLDPTSGATEDIQCRALAAR